MHSEFYKSVLRGFIATPPKDYLTDKMMYIISSHLTSQLSTAVTLRMALEAGVPQGHPLTLAEYDTWVNDGGLGLRPTVIVTVAEPTLLGKVKS